MAGGRSERAVQQHTDSRLCAYPALGRVSSMGLGHPGQRPGPVIAQTVWFGIGIERAYTSDDAESGREYHFSYSHVYRIPSTSAWHGSCTWPYEGAGRKITGLTGTYKRELYRA